MITTGEIKRVFTDDNDTVLCDVDISIFKSTLSNYNENNKLIGSIYTATICTPPGLYMPYKVGDIVYVGFMNDDISYPIIIGMVHKNLPSENDSSSYAYLKALNVSDNVKLPEATSIGDIEFSNLKSSFLRLNNLETITNGSSVSYNDSESVIGTCVLNGVSKTLYRLCGTKQLTSTGTISLKVFDYNITPINMGYNITNNGVVYNPIIATSSHGYPEQSRIEYDKSTNTFSIYCPTTLTLTNASVIYIIEYTKD